MIPVRTRSYQTQANPDIVFTRIGLDAERVCTLVDTWSGNVTEDTSKPWVGKIDSSAGHFELLETNASLLPVRILEGNFFNLFVRGEVMADPESNKTVIGVRYTLGLQATLTLVLAYIFPIGLAVGFIGNNDWEALRGLLPWLLVFNILPTVLLIVQLNRIENKVIELLGIERDPRD